MVIAYGVIDKLLVVFCLKLYSLESTIVILGFLAESGANDMLVVLFMLVSGPNVLLFAFFDSINLDLVYLLGSLSGGGDSLATPLSSTNMTPILGFKSLLMRCYSNAI